MWIESEVVVFKARLRNVLSTSLRALPFGLGRNCASSLTCGLKMKTARLTGRHLTGALGWRLIVSSNHQPVSIASALSSPQALPTLEGFNYIL